MQLQKEWGKYSCNISAIGQFYKNYYGILFMMKINYDKDADALYIQFGVDKADKTVEKRGNILIDYDKKGNVLGIEVLDYSVGKSRANKQGVAVGQKKVAVLN